MIMRYCNGQIIVRKMKRQPRLPFYVALGARGQLHAEFLTELFDAPSGVHDLLLAGVERVALRADFHALILLAHGRARYELVATAACDVDFSVIRVNIGFHAWYPNLMASRSEERRVGK